MTELDSWPTIEEAAKQLQTSMRTMLRHKERGAIEVRQRSVPGRRPVNIVNPNDLFKLMPPAFVAQALKPNTDYELLRTISPAPPNGISIGEKLWLTLDEAAAYSGIPRSYVKQYAHEGAIPAQRFGRSWRIKRASLEAFQG